MPARRRPNILFICTDQEYAHPYLPAGVTLPNHDRLAARGVTFEHFQATTTFCTPARSVIYAGQHAPRTGMWDNLNYVWINDLSTGVPTIGHMLRAAGYYTAYKGKWLLSKLPSQQARETVERYGFADFQERGEIWGAPLDGYNHDGEIAAEAADWLRSRAPEIARSGPWYLAVNLINPQDITWYDTDAEKGGHSPGILKLYGAPASAQYRQQWATELPASFSDDLSGQPDAVKAYAKYVSGVYGFIPHDRPDLWHSHLNYYVNCLRDVDRHVGSVLDALQAAGQGEDTVVVFTSDHGEIAAAHGLRQKGGVAFKELVDVPFIVCHPEGQRGAVTQAVGSALDVVPTLLSFAGVSAEERRRLYPQLKGHDLSGVVTRPDSDGPRGSHRAPGIGALYTYDMLHSVDVSWLMRHATQVADLGMVMETGFGPEPPQAEGILGHIEPPDLSRRRLFRGVFDSRYKLVRYFAPAQYNTPETLAEALDYNDLALYDLQRDPDEMHNLAHPAHPDYDAKLVAEMNAKLTALIKAEIGQDKALVEFPSQD
jgi:arylsulfatase A-like enzyme